MYVLCVVMGFAVWFCQTVLDFGNIYLHRALDIDNQYWEIKIRIYDKWIHMTII